MQSPGCDLASVAAMIGQPARAAMLDALMSGVWLTAGELARAAGVTAPTATGHLDGLARAGLVKRRRSGRHHYHALAGPDVAAALEALARIPSPGEGAPRPAPADPALGFARMCYDHLAGSLGVLLADTLVERGYVVAGGTELSPEGESWLAGLGIDVASLRARRRTFVRACLDWTERRDHLAGAVGAALTESLLSRSWIVRRAETRAVRLTARGRDGLYRVLGLEMGQRL